MKPEYQHLLKSMTEESVMASIKPEEVKANRKSRKIHVEVMDLKVKLSTSEARVIVLSNREIRLLRYIDLTDEIIKKIDSNQKVARKIERLLRKEGSGKDADHSDSDEDDDDGRSNSNSSENDSNTVEKMTSSDFDTNDEYSLSSLTSSTTPSLTISCGGQKKGHERLKQLPTSHSSPSLALSLAKCCCSCHSSSHVEEDNLSMPSMSTSAQMLETSSPCAKPKTRDSVAQTLSTGDIVITKVIFDENE